MGRDLAITIAACLASVAFTGVANRYLHGPAAAAVVMPAPIADDVAPAPGGLEEREAQLADVGGTTPPAPALAPPEHGMKIAPSHAKSTSEAENLFADAGRARRIGAAPKAIALYRLLQKRYPDAPQSRAADLALAVLLLRQGAHEPALDHFERYLRHSPHGELAPEAMWGKTQALTNLGRAQDARRTLNRLQMLYPDSPYASQARVESD